MTPLKHQKIHWRSVPGSGSLGGLEVQNRGQIRFMRKGPQKCAVKLTISYEVPNVLAPFANVSVILIHSFGAENHVVSSLYADIRFYIIAAAHPIS